MVAVLGRSRRSRPLPYPVRFGILGGGSFGLALATLLGKKNIPVTILVRKPEIAEHMNTLHRHPTYLSDIELPVSIRATTDPEEALRDASFIIHAVPVQYSRKFLTDLAPHMPPSTPIISVSKGIETGTLAMMQDILSDTLGPTHEFAFLSGPSFAREIAQGLATAVVVASDSEPLANEICDLLSSDYFRVFTSTDVVGVEVRSQPACHVVMWGRQQHRLMGLVCIVLDVAGGRCGEERDRHRGRHVRGAGPGHQRHGRSRHQGVQRDAEASAEPGGSAKHAHG